MSVDTFLKGKRTSEYQRLRADGIEVLLSPKLGAWAAQFVLDAKGFFIFQWFKPGVAHAHGPT